MLQPDIPFTKYQFHAIVIEYGNVNVISYFMECLLRAHIKTLIAVL